MNERGKEKEDGQEEVMEQRGKGKARKDETRNTKKTWQGEEAECIS